MWVPAVLAAACCVSLIAAAPSPGPQLPLEPPLENAIIKSREQPDQHKGLLGTQIHRLRVGQPYTLQQKHRKTHAGPAHPRTPAASRPAGVETDTADPMLEPFAGTALEFALGPVTERVGERIIRVPIRRASTGCRYHQGVDVRGKCRNRW